MPVHELVKMPYEEFLGWIAYFEQRPVGWREDIRTMKLLQSNGVKARPETLFDSLAQMSRANNSRTDELVAKGQVSSANLIRSAFFSKMLSAKGGESLDIFDGKD